MFEVTMRHSWHDVVFNFDSMFEAGGFISAALESAVPCEDELFFTVKKIKEETENAETVCGTEEG